MNYEILRFVVYENKAKIFSMLIVIFLFHTLSFATDNLPMGDAFQNAIKLYQEQKYSEAEEIYASEWALKRENSSLLFNWGLNSYQLKQKGKAVALWRRALFLDPENTSASRALEFISNEMPNEVFNPHATGFENLNQSLLRRASLNKFMFGTFIIFIVSGFLTLRYFKSRKNALDLEQPLPPTPVTAIILLILLCASTFLSVAKTISEFSIRATVITSNSVLRTGPNEQDNTLFELLEGFEVIVRNVDKNWVQVKLPEGVTGWVPSTDLIQHTGQDLLW